MAAFLRLASPVSPAASVLCDTTSLTDGLGEHIQLISSVYFLSEQFKRIYYVMMHTGSVYRVTRTTE